MAKVRKKLDYILLGIVGLLVSYGFIILASASTHFSVKNFDTPYYSLLHQLKFGLIPGLLFLYFFSKFSLDILKKTIPFLLLGSLLLMVLVFVPGIGLKSGSAARWISLGGLSFQPSELLKLTFILYLASWLESRSNKAVSSKDTSESLFAFFFIISSIAAFLLLQSDVGTLGTIVLTAILMYFFSERPLWHTGLIVTFSIVGLLLFIGISPYRRERMMIFFNPEMDSLGAGYQTNQALIAIGSGGLLGVGAGMSEQKLSRLPHPDSDSIFAILAEETGFVGAVILLFLFALFLWRGYEIGTKSTDTFSRLTALGITSWILIQTFVNIGAMINFLPITGIPLPFISYGGSAMLIELSAIGILLNISKTSLN